MLFGIGFEIMFVIVFVLVVITFVVILGQSARQWHHNNESPRLTVDAEVVAKRTNVTGGARHGMGSTSYYVTFQVESGDRLELQMPGSDYGMLAEKDRGKLTFQGTRFLGFERSRD